MVGNRLKLSDTNELQSQSFFRLYRMPEQTRDLEITASLMRALSGVGEGAGVSAAPEFSAQIYTQDSTKIVQNFDNCAQSWLGQRLLTEGLKVPPSEKEKPGKKANRVLTLVPITPSIAKYCCFTRKKGNPWNPGAYIEGMLLRGSPSNLVASELWKKLAEAFAVPTDGEGERQDAWAVIIERAASSLMGEEVWDGKPVNELRSSKGWARYPGAWIESLPAHPSTAFVQDIETLIQLEGSVTRRAWIGIIDCYLRLAISADMLWVGRMNRNLERLIRDADQLNHDSEISEGWVVERFLQEFSPIEIGGHCERILRQEVREFGKSQLFVRSYLELVSERALREVIDAGGLSSLEGLTSLAKVAQGSASSLLGKADSIRGQIIDDNPNMMSLRGRKTWTHQLYFALRYGLGQRSASEANRHFDQGYWCRKSGPAKNHPWNFEISPVGITLMVHLVAAGSDMATARDLQLKLRNYGIGISMTDISRGAIGSNLRRLGLVTDSPDAEGGMVLRSPFRERNDS